MGSRPTRCACYQSKDKNVFKVFFFFFFFFLKWEMVLELVFRVMYGVVKLP